MRTRALQKPIAGAALRASGALLIVKPKGLPAPVTGQTAFAGPSGDGVDYSRAVVTHCPSGVDRRFVAEPGAFGAGFAAVGIGRNVDTGRAWE